MGLEELGTAELFEMPANVYNVGLYPLGGPWKTKADANLYVGFAMPFVADYKDGEKVSADCLPFGERV